jgi:hypothetical protein
MATVEELQAQLDKLTSEKDSSDKDAEKWKALSRKNEDEKKANAEKAKLADELQAKLDAAEAAKLTEAEKAAKSIADLAKSVEDLKASNAASELAALRSRIGAEKKLPAQFADRLRGDTEETLAADADAVLEAIGAAKKGSNHVSREGATPNAPKSDDAAFARELFGGGE